MHLGIPFKLNGPFEDVRNFPAAFFRAVDGYLRGLFSARGDVLSGILGSAVSQTIGLLGAVGGLNSDRLGATDKWVTAPAVTFRPPFPTLTISSTVSSAPLAV